MLGRGVRDDDEGIVVDLLGEEAVGVEDQGDGLAERKICDVARHLLRPYPLVHQDVDLAQLRDGPPCYVQFDELLCGAVDMPDDQKDAALKTYKHDPEAPLTVLLKDDTACIRCGLCATRCPTEAMTMERFNFVEVVE